MSSSYSPAFPWTRNREAVGIGHQDFEQLITNDYFYVDKTGFIKEWWESGDVVTLLTRHPTAQHFHGRAIGKQVVQQRIRVFAKYSYRFAECGIHILPHLWDLIFR